MKTCSVYKKTSDNWCPNYNYDFVMVSFCQTGPNPPINGEWRVCVWGADDFGMERDFKNKDEAWQVFIEVISLDNVTIDELKLLEFISA